MSSSPRASRVASRHLAREWKPDQVEMRFKSTRERVLRYDAEWASALTRDPPGVRFRWEKKSYQDLWWWLKNDAEYAIAWILETRALPPGHAKRVEMLARAFMSYKRAPDDVLVWWLKHRPLLNLFFEADGWREKVLTDSEGEGDGHSVQEVFTVGPFTVHNTLHLTGDKLAKTKDVIERAVKAIRSRGARLSKVLYGDVRVVGQLKGGNVSAWYYPSDDEVYLRPILRVSSDVVHNLCHELGHRLWHKEMGQAQQHEWVHAYNLRKRSPKSVALPKVGEPLPIPVQGHKGDAPPIVEKYMGGSIYLVGGGHVSAMTLLRMLEEQASFPTLYAATLSTEYFAECFAMYCLGTLDADHTETFERIARP